LEPLLLRIFESIITCVLSRTHVRLPALAHTAGGQHCSCLPRPGRNEPIRSRRKKPPITTRTECAAHYCLENKPNKKNGGGVQPSRQRQHSFIVSSAAFAFGSAAFAFCVEICLVGCVVGLVACMTTQSFLGSLWFAWEQPIRGSDKDGKLFCCRCCRDSAAFPFPKFASHLLVVGCVHDNSISWTFNRLLWSPSCLFHMPAKLSLAFLVRS
jgi:hypothetical protein